MNSFKKKSKKIKKKRDKKGKKDKKRKRSSSSNSSSSDSSSIDSSSLSSSSNSSIDKHKHKRRKHKKDRKRKKTKRSDEKCVKLTGESSKCISNQDSENEDFSIPINLMDNKQKAPETKEAYEKRQSVVRRVIDEETGRSRLIKGDGEVIEEIVSRDRHREINKLATQTDGQVYHNKSIGWAVTSNKK